VESLAFIGFVLFAKFVVHIIYTQIISWTNKLSGWDTDNLFWIFNEASKLKKVVYRVENSEPLGNENFSHHLGCLRVSSKLKNHHHFHGS